MVAELCTYTHNNDYSREHMTTYPVPSICRSMHIHTLVLFCLTSIACSNIPLLSFENEVIFTLTTHSCYTYMYVNCFSSHLKLAEGMKLTEGLKLAEGL